jgi:hypothetical protein
MDRSDEATMRCQQKDSPMGTRSIWGAVAAVLLLLCQAGAARAHPHLLGTWTSPTPPGGYMALDFGPAELLGVGVWRGCFTITYSGYVSSGIYELRMYSGTEGTLGLRDGNMIATKVGTVDFMTNEVIYLNTHFRR